MDASTDVKGESVTVHVTHFPDGTVICQDVIHSQIESHDAPWVAAEIQRMIALTTNEQSHCGACTDNTNANKAAWKILSVANPDKFFHGCICHALHLAVGDIIKGIPELSDTIGIVKDLIFFIFRNQKLLFEIRQSAIAAKKPFLVKPCTTRWGVICRSVKSILDNEEGLLAVLTDAFVAAGRNLDERSRRKVFKTSMEDFNFIYKLRQCVTMLKPWCDLIVKFEGEKIEISEVYNDFEELKLTIVNMPTITDGNKAIIENIRLAR
jgi:hypothetical protein